jgi:hypothetical protein
VDVEKLHIAHDRASCERECRRNGVAQLIEQALADLRRGESRGKFSARISVFTAELEDSE